MASIRPQGLEDWKQNVFITFEHHFHTTLQSSLCLFINIWTEPLLKNCDFVFQLSHTFWPMNVNDFYVTFPAIYD